MSTKQNGDGEGLNISEITGPTEVAELQALVEDGTVVSGDPAMAEITGGISDRIEKITDPTTLAELNRLCETEGTVPQAEVEKELGL